MRRDREQTKRKILGAVNRVLAKKGFGGVGVNAIAKEAGVDKVLIYRYFGGLSQLLRTFGETSAFWPTFEEFAGSSADGLKDKPFDERVRHIMMNFAHALQRRPMTQEIMAWETVERTRLNAVLINVRKKMGQRLFKEFGLSSSAPQKDALAVITLLVAAINYLVLRSRLDKDFNGMDIRSRQGWQKIERAIGLICAKCLS